jgi:hypothetical protein
MKFQIEVLPDKAWKEAGVVKTLRLAGGMSLRDAQEVFHYMRGMERCTIASGMDEAVAREVAAQLTTGGVDAEIAPSTFDTPMVCRPGVNQVYRWSPLRLLQRSRR